MFSLKAVVDIFGSNFKNYLDRRFEVKNNNKEIHFAFIDDAVSKFMLDNQSHPSLQNIFDFYNTVHDKYREVFNNFKEKNKLFVFSDLYIQDLMVSFYVVALPGKISPSDNYCFKLENMLIGMDKLACTSTIIPENITTEEGVKIIKEVTNYIAKRKNILVRVIKSDNPRIYLINL